MFGNYFGTSVSCISFYQIHVEAGDMGPEPVSEVLNLRTSQDLLKYSKNLPRLKAVFLFDKTANYSFSQSVEQQLPGITVANLSKESGIEEYDYWSQQTTRSWEIKFTFFHFLTNFVVSFGALKVFASLISRLGSGLRKPYAAQYTSRQICRRCW